MSALSHREIEEAKEEIRTVAERHGARLRRVSTIEWAGPCPLCGGRDRFSVNVRLRLWNCRGCGVGGDAITLERHMTGASFNKAVATIVGEMEQRPRSRPRLRPDPLDEAGKTTTADAMKIWKEAVDPRGTLVDKLYFPSRSLVLGDDVAGEVLRWHPGIGAMIALFRNIMTNEPQAVSRTFLNREGRKIGRKARYFLGPVVGAAIKLDSDDTVIAGLHAGEGFETCHSARALGMRPCWALGSTSGIRKFPVLNGVQCLTLLQENDGNDKGKSADACAVAAARWHAEGREVHINTSLIGNDLNDAVKGAPREES